MSANAVKCHVFPRRSIISFSHRIRIGIGGWTFEPWRETFYPDSVRQKDELHYASRQVSSIEVNGTYYRSQKPDTFAQWHDQTPDDFIFALKAPRYATNRKVLADAGQSIGMFVDSGIGRLGSKLGPVNWQFMATKVFDPGDFEAFLRLLPDEADGAPLRHAVEVRHESFCCRDFIDLARKYSVAIITAGDSEYPQIGDQTADFAYLRIMGTEARFKAGYGPKDLDEWARRARSLRDGHMPEGLRTVGEAQKPGARDVFAYVISGHKALNPLAARELMKRV